MLGVGVVQGIAEPEEEPGLGPDNAEAIDGTCSVEGVPGLVPQVGHSGSANGHLLVELLRVATGRL
eukprot:3750759-Lingulodinium_polyedra.AAC.1